MVKLIVATTENNFIGNEGKLVVHDKEEMTMFKALTLHHPVIMGRKTWESLKSPLIDRLNIVLSRGESIVVKDNVLFCNLEYFMEHCFSECVDYWVIGGAEIYSLFLDLGIVDQAYVSFFFTEGCGDVKFPIEKVLTNFSHVVTKEFPTFTQKIFSK